MLCLKPRDTGAFRQRRSCHVIVRHPRIIFVNVRSGGWCFKVKTCCGGGGVPDTCRPAASRNCLATHVRYPISVRERQPYRRHKVAKHPQLASAAGTRAAGGGRELWLRHQLAGHFSSANRNGGPKMLFGRGGQQQPWAIDAARRGRATATMGHRCCGNRIHGPPLRFVGRAEQQRWPIVAAAKLATPG